MRKLLIVMSLTLTLWSGCTLYPAAVLSNLIAGASQGGLANPTALLDGALQNGLLNIIGVLPPP